MSAEVYEAYAGVRQVPSGSPIMSDIELIVQSGTKANRVYDYIRENSDHRVKIQDVYNLITRIKATGT